MLCGFCLDTLCKYTSCSCSLSVWKDNYFTTPINSNTFIVIDKKYYFHYVEYLHHVKNVTASRLYDLDNPDTCIPGPVVKLKKEITNHLNGKK